MESIAPLESKVSAMSEEARNSGIDVMGDVPWGTHFCLFYQTREDLLDVLVPYFRAGLKQNEFCMWVTSEPLNAEDAKSSLGKVVEHLDDYIDKGQIEILDYTEWYTKSGTFEPDEVLRGWIAKESQAVKRGFDGLRLTGNTLWLEEEDWKSFNDYERAVEGVIGEHRMLASCTYSLDRCRAHEIMDVVSAHQFALIRRQGKWEVVQSAERMRAEEALRQRERELSIRNRIDLIFLTVPDDAMYGEVLQIILEETQSKYGVFGYINEDGSWVAPSLTKDIWEQCQVADKDIIFPRETWGGIWGRALIEGKALLSNEPGRVPDGHIPVLRSMVVPITHNDEVIGGITLANKATDYDEQDIKLVEGIADFIALVLRARLQRDREERERKRAEGELERHQQQLEKLVAERTAELRGTNELLERILSTTYLLIAYIDSDFNFIRVNRAYAAADGREPEFFVGKNHFDLYPHEENESIFRAVVETGQPYTASAKPFEYAEHPERGVTHWDWTLHPVQDASGKVEALVLALVDVSERIRAEETLRESEENFRALAQNASDGIVILTREGDLAYANQRASEITGYSVAELLEMNVEDVVHPHDLQKVMERLQKRLAGERVPTQYEIAVVEKSGGTVPVEIAAARTVWHGQPADIVLVRDITERKRAQTALIQSEKLAITGRLAASLAHEINNPLQTVIGCLGLAAETLAAGGNVGEYLQISREELQRASRIVTELRDLQRKSEPERRESTHMSRLLERVLTLSRKRCEEHRVEVVWEAAADLPPLMLVPDRMQQVFLNLILNAVDAMPEGGLLQVRAIPCGEPDGVSVSFIDNGVGIAPEVLHHIFDPFYSTKYQGLGLGLFVSQNIVEEHGGHIEVESQLGEGSTFTVWLPT